ncbi:hypothetical protein SAMN05216311_114177 [Chitinophaga sp. CF418]|nr:hypothetical protein SAMN05216311_114177 [Chitinophaga sp. CF418]
MYGKFDETTIRSYKSRKQIHKERRELIGFISSKLQHGDFKTIERRLGKRLTSNRRGEQVVQGMSYNSVRYTLDPEHPLFCKRVIEEAMQLIIERESQEDGNVGN